MEMNEEEITKKIHLFLAYYCKSEEFLVAVKAWSKSKNYIHPQEYIKNHKNRYIKSFQWISPYMKKGVKVLGIGGNDFFTAFLNHSCPGISIEY